MILDVGCGGSPVGDVNCDLYVGFNSHRGECSSVLDVGFIKNFVLCDCHFLPFKDGCFDVVVSRQVIEHVCEPLIMFGELVRVSCHVVRVETVLCFTEALRCSINGKVRRWVRLHHINKFNQRKLISFGSRFGLRFVRGYNVAFWCLPHEYLCLLRFPTEFGVEFVKS